MPGMQQGFKDITSMRFKKRTYNSPKDFISDVLFPFKNRRKLQGVMGGTLISPSFRERLMLAVTAVNGCRYCSYFHTGEALKSGLSREEIGLLLSGESAACPPEEAPAVIYAQHWAESNACPDPIALQKLQEIYGIEKAAAIQIILRMIRIGNLSGNSWDYLLYRVSFGKWGQ
jgi:AhpD family alkylhydroperoxidase